MTSWEIILVLVGFPLAVMLLLALFTLGPNIRRRRRYRPGQEWNHPPVWWTAEPERLRSAQVPPHAPEATGAARGGCRGDW